VSGAPGGGAGARPPFGGRWGVLYAAVIAALAAEIALLEWLTEFFR
jgi:hypothetical protein